MSDEIPALEVTAEAAAPAAEPAPAAAEAPRRKKGPNLHWNRPKSHVYEYNFDYGGNYYKVQLAGRVEHGTASLQPPTTPAQATAQADALHRRVAGAAVGGDEGGRA
jgi:hypothetical protein